MSRVSTRVVSIFLCCVFFIGVVALPAFAVGEGSITGGITGAGAAVSPYISISSVPYSSLVSGSTTTYSFDFSKFTTLRVNRGPDQSSVSLAKYPSSLQLNISPDEYVRIRYETEYFSAASLRSFSGSSLNFTFNPYVFNRSGYYEVSDFLGLCTLYVMYKMDSGYRQQTFTMSQDSTGYHSSFTLNSTYLNSCQGVQFIFQLTPDLGLSSTSLIEFGFRNQVSFCEINVTDPVYSRSFSIYDHTGENLLFIYQSTDFLWGNAQAIKFNFSASDKIEFSGSLNPASWSNSLLQYGLISMTEGAPDLSVGDSATIYNTSLTEVKYKLAKAAVSAEEITDTILSGFGGIGSGISGWFESIGSAFSGFFNGLNNIGTILQNFGANLFPAWIQNLQSQIDKSVIAQSFNKITSFFQNAFNFVTPSTPSQGEQSQEDAFWSSLFGDDFWGWLNDNDFVSSITSFGYRMEEMYTKFPQPLKYLIVLSFGLPVSVGLIKSFLG